MVNRKLRALQKIVLGEFAIVISSRKVFQPSSDAQSGLTPDFSSFSDVLSFFCLAELFIQIQSVFLSFRSLLLYKHDTYSFINVAISNCYQLIQRKRQKGTGAKMDFKGITFVLIIPAA